MRKIQIEPGSCPQSSTEAPDLARELPPFSWSARAATSPALFVATVDFWGPLISGHPNSPKILYLPVFQHLLIPHGNTDKLHFYIPWRNHQQSILTQGLNSYIAFKRHVIQHVCSHWESTLPLYLCLVGNPYLPPTSTPRGECGPCQTEAPRRFSKTHEMSSHL